MGSSTLRSLLAISLLLSPILIPWPSSLGAQDVLRAGEAAGVSAPAWVRNLLIRDPDAFEFGRAWKSRTAAVRNARRDLESRVGPALAPTQLAAEGAVLTGTLLVPVVAAQYSDQFAPYSPAELQERLFGGGAGAVSIRDFYLENSGGVFSVNGTVSSWVAMPSPAAYYEPPAGGDDRFGRIWEFLRDALTAADADIDFGQFDNDGPDGIPNSGDDDGWVDVVAFVYASVAAACGDGGTGIWPHRSRYSVERFFNGDGQFLGFATNDVSALGGVVGVDDYIVQSAVECDGASIMGSGVIAHELGHALDLPDLYDTDLEDGSDSQGIGSWGLMGAGGWNRPTSPGHLSAWSKDLLGWVTVFSTDDPASFTLEPVNTDRAVIRIDLPESDEYLLLSNRQPLGSDQFLMGPGLLIWHVDPSKAGTISEKDNGQNVDPAHKAVDVEEADGRDDLDSNENAGDAGDPFPGSTFNRVLADYTYPSSQPYTGAQCTAAVHSISLGGATVTGQIVPSERWVIWGDANGSRTLVSEDSREILWYALGYRNADEQTYLDQTDVDGDGDIDVRDGFLVLSYVNGFSVPGGRLGSSELRACGPIAGALPVLAEGATPNSGWPSPARGNRDQGPRPEARRVIIRGLQRINH